MKNRKLSRRDFLKLSGTASLGLILSACGVTPPMATPTSPATATPTHTPTTTPTATARPTATPTATPTPIPTIQVGDLTVPDPRYSNPELFDLTNPDAPIPQFVNALKNAGIEVSLEQLQEGLTYQVLEDTEGNPFVIGVYSLDESLFPEEYSDLAGPIPLFIVRQNEKREWEWGKNVLRGHRVSIGFSGWYPNNIEIIRTEANRLVSAWEFIFDNYEPPLVDNQGYYHFEQPDNVVRLACSNNLEIRAQDLLYGVPSYIENRQNTEDELLTFIENHIRMTMQRYKGKVDQWSVANEIMQPWGDVSFLYNYFGPNDLRWLVLAFNTAHEVDPNATLILNDTGIEFLTTHPRWLSGYSDRFFNLVNQLKQQEAPIDAVGFQMHLYAEDYTTEEQLNNAILSFQENIRRYKALGIDVIITEWDIRLGSLSNYSYEERILLQTKIYQRFLSAALESGVTDISFFSVNDEDSWLEDPNIGGQNASLNDPCLFTRRRPKLPYYAVLRTLTF